jgi:hypothetical protein
MNPEIIRAITPLFLAAIGGGIAITVLLQPNLSEGQWAAGLGLSGTAIAGAAGLAQTTRQESNITAQDNAQIVQDTEP